MTFNSSTSRWQDRWQSLVVQFQHLNLEDTASWPLVPRLAACVLSALAVVGVVWFFLIKDINNDLSQAQEAENSLRSSFENKVGQANRLSALQRQKKEVEQYVQQLEKQLPSKSEMDALLHDVSHLGNSHNVRFELFQPGQIDLKTYYAELPIAIKLTGRYHDLGALLADIAKLSRIVTLNNIQVDSSKEPGVLSLDATAKTFRYLDADEIQTQRKAAAKAIRR